MHRVPSFRDLCERVGDHRIRSKRVKREEYRSHQTPRRCSMIPAQMLAEVVCDEDGEDHQRDHFLNHFKLDRTEPGGPDAVGGNLEAILEEGDKPADENHLPERLMPEPKVPIPGKGHEDVGDGEKNDGPHFVILCTEYGLSCEIVLDLTVSQV